MNIALDRQLSRSTTSIGDLVAARIRAAAERLVAYREKFPARTLGDRSSDLLAWSSESEEGESHSAIIAATESLLNSGGEGAVRRRLHALFRLDPAESDLLDCALALQSDPSLPGMLLKLFGHAGLLEQSVIALFGHANRPILRPTSPLLRWALVETTPGGLSIDPDIAALVAGRAGLDHVLVDCAMVIEPPTFQISNWPIADAAEAITRLMAMGRSVRVILSGLEGNGRQVFAAALVNEMSGAVLRVSPHLAAAEDQLYMRAQRLAMLTGHAIYWDGQMPRRPVGLSNAPLQFVASAPGVSLPAVEGMTDLCLDVPAPSKEAKESVWQEMAGSHVGFTLDSCGRIASSARLHDVLVLAEHAPENKAQARALLARKIRSRIEGCGNILNLPYARKDLVLAPQAEQQLDTIIAELHARDELLARPGLALHYGRLGQSLLFHGPSGTGKTMAAQVVARELDVDLVRIDCASIISKYIGEAIRNLRDLFDRLRGSGAVAFFDEADALFAKRTELKDSHDRHANSDTNYLLQLIEEFDGIAILATNRKENIDTAFLRRLRYVVEFGELGCSAREQLWQRHLELLVADTPTAGWAARLALAELSPAQIKGAALSGLFIGRAESSDRTEIEYFISGIERELAKDGHALDSGLRRRIKHA